MGHTTDIVIILTLVIPVSCKVRSNINVPYVVILVIAGFLVYEKTLDEVRRKLLFGTVKQCFSTAGPRPGTGPWHQLYRAARDSPGIGHFSFLSIFHE